MTDYETRNTQDAPPKRRSSRLADLGPLWITAIATLIAALGTAGFFTGRATATKAAPAQTVTVTATPRATSSVGASSSTPSVSSGAQPSSAGDGNVRATYTVKLPAGYGTPIGTTAPTQSQFAPGGSGDLYENDGSLLAGNGSNKMLSLPAGTTPTYQACASNTLFVQSVPAAAASSFCIVETGRMVGGTVTAVSSNTNPIYYTLHITVWQNS
jgi:hypothetical protein